MARPIFSTPYLLPHPTNPSRQSCAYSARFHSRLGDSHRHLDLRLAPFEPEHCLFARVPAPSARWRFVNRNSVHSIASIARATPDLESHRQSAMPASHCFAAIAGWPKFDRRRASFANYRAFQCVMACIWDRLHSRPMRARRGSSRYIFYVDRSISCLSF